MKPSRSSSCLYLLALSTSISITLFLLISTLFFVWTDPRGCYYYSSLTSMSMTTSTSLDHIVFGLASAHHSWPTNKDLVKLWWGPNRMRGCVFIDSLPSSKNTPSNGSSVDDDDALLPPLCVSQDASRFRYTYRNGPKSSIRVARIISEIVNLNHTNVRWYVFGDDDTVFFPENLAKTLSKYDHELWYYVGTNSEVHEQNRIFSFDMAFWGAGFAISAPLAKVLARVFDSCLERYPHIYGSDGRVHSCLAELGVGLTRDPGFHQVDLGGNIFGVLAAHPLAPIASLPHLTQTDSIFPNMTSLTAISHLFKAVKIDSHRVLQQTVCYDRWFSWTISISWGYAVQIFDHHVYLPDALRTQETFRPRKKNAEQKYTFSTRPIHVDPCRRPTVFFLNGVSQGRKGIRSNYKRIGTDNCTFDPMGSPKKLEEIVVHTQKLNLGIRELLAPRRQCCDVLRSSSASHRLLEISVRECKEAELIHIHA